MSAPPLRTSAALRLGARLVKESLPWLGLLFAARAVQGVVEGSLGVAFTAISEGPGLGLGVTGAAASVWLIAELVAAVVLVMAAIGACARLAGSPTTAPVSRIAVGYFFVGGAVILAAKLWTWTALGASLGAYFLSLLTGRHGGASALALSLSLLVALPLAFMATLWTRLGLVSAATRGTGYAPGLLDAVSLLQRRFGTTAGVLALTGAVGGVIALVAAGTVMPFSPSFMAPSAQEVSWAVSVVGATLGALGAAAGQLWGITALCAIGVDASRGLAPEFLPPAPEPILAALPLPDAAVPAPIVEAVPLIATPVEQPQDSANSPESPGVIDALPVKTDPEK